MVEMVATARLNDLPIAYVMEGEGTTMVFIHEVATDHRLWHHQRTYFRTRYRRIVVDVLGHGQVAWPRHEISIEYAARRVQQLLERQGTGPAFVIGVSMGAAVAMWLALEAPALVQGLVLVSPWSDADDYMQRLVNQLYRVAEAEDMATYIDMFLRYIFPSADLDRYTSDVGLLRALALAQNPKVVADALAACLAFNVRGRLKEIRVPGLVIAGMQDLFTPPYLARAVAEGLSEGKLEIWEETGHFPLLEDPVRFNGRLEAFILCCLGQARGAE
jgi:pimeloyl-ACP methyl ester carboxylesterase